MDSSDLTLSDEELRKILESSERPKDATVENDAPEGKIGDEPQPSETDLESEASGPSEEQPANGHGKQTARVQRVEFSRVSKPEPAADRARVTDLGIILDVPLRVTVELGRTEMTVRELLELGPGSVVELDRSAGEVLDILVNGVPIARGEVVVVDEQFGVRITDVFDSSSADIANSLTRRRG